MALRENPLFIFTVLKAYKIGILIFTGEGRWVFVTYSVETHFVAEEITDTSWHPGPRNDFASASINNA